MAADFVGILSATHVFIGVGARKDFDKIDRPVIDRGFTQEAAGHVLVKTVEQDGVTVVFQHWLIDAPIKQNN